MGVKNVREIDVILIKKQQIMLTHIHPKLPMRCKTATKEFYVNKLGFTEIGNFESYLMLKKDAIEIHFFEFKDLNPAENYGQVYIRTNHIEQLYQSLLANKVAIHSNGHLATKSWQQKEFALLDPDYNLLTFGEGL